MMNKQHILFIFGTRPEAIKLAPLIHATKACDQFNVSVCLTAQHRQMLDQVLEVFDIKADYDLNIMVSEQSLYTVTAKILLALEDVLTAAKPDMIIVHGDTTTCFTSALAGFYKQIPVAHVEAGLRTNKLYSPFPEEVNRTLTASLATLHFAPTQAALKDLLSENIAADSIFVTGNTVIDALLWVREKIEQQPALLDQYPIMPTLKAITKPLILVTGHRRENFGSGLKAICQALLEIAKKYPQWQIVYPVHLNPNVKNTVLAHLSGVDNILLIEPLEYIPFVYLMDKSKIILTDSGGIQEEAPSLGKPVLVMREVTERPEGIAAGTAVLVGTDSERIVSAVETLINDAARYQAMAKARNPYGDGNASSRICNIIANYLSK